MIPNNRNPIFFTLVIIVFFPLELTKNTSKNLPYYKVTSILTNI